MNFNLNSMKQIETAGLVLTTVLLGLVGLGGCSVEADKISRVQTNVVEKSIFDGEWWYATTNIGVDTDSAYVLGSTGAFAPWTGDMSSEEYAYGGGVMSRIRWVIDQNYLYGYRAYELISGGNADGRSPEFRGQPLVAFKIQSHFNIQCDYNTVTGECTNVTSENGSDSRWYETRYMRVDWSQNMVTPFRDDIADLYKLFAVWSSESVSFHIQEGSAFPEEWRPQFVTVGDERACAQGDLQDSSCYRWANEWPAGSEGLVHYMSFVTQEVLTPNSCGSGGCNPVNVTKRHAFLRVPPNHEYAAETSTYREFDRFGILKTSQRTYVRGGEDQDVTHIYCDSDDDCTTEGTCDTQLHYCVGGLTSDIGETDFMNFYRLRHNFYSDSLTDKVCTTDWECDGRYSGVAGTPGSVCDQGAKVCTIPIDQRPTRAVAYHLNPGFPAYLARSAFQTIGEWNGIFMKGQRSTKGVAAPSGPPIACQSNNPGDYCYCASDMSLKAAEVGDDNTCPWQYNPFVSKAEAEAAGVINAYDCSIEGPADQVNPTSFDAYDRTSYDYRFVGEECLFVLKPNDCNLDPAAECQQLGDIRYQFFNYIAHGQAQFCGVMEPLQDPRNGEAIVSPANMSGECLESIGTTASQYFPVLRGETDEEEYFQAEHIRGYFDRIGRTQHPSLTAVSGTDGYSTNDNSRPGLPLLPADIIKNLKPKFDAAKVLRGSEGRAMLMSDRLQQLQGTDLEQRFVAALGSGGSEAMLNLLTADELALGPSMRNEAVMDKISPFREGFRDSVDAERKRLEILSARGIEMPRPDLYTSRYWAYWARAFAGRSNEEADIRMRQAFHRSVMLHEIGHAIGLEHNFAGSLDRNNYFDGFFNIVDEHPLPALNAYDLVVNGGDADGNADVLEVNRYQAALRAARNARAERGAGNVMSSSIMEYPGDLSDMSGLGRYDNAAVIWNYFNRYEATVGDAADRVCETDADCGTAGSCRAPVRGVRLCEYRSGNEPNTTFDNIRWANQHDRVYFDYYRGGESCDTNSDCPSTLREGQTSSRPFYQRCIKNVRDERLPEACDGDGRCQCSSFDDDFLDYTDGVAFRSPAEEPEFTPSPYLFCTNGRDNDISWCSMFDAGESFREVIDHYRRGWEENYPNSYHRRYRRGFQGGPSSYSSIVAAVKIYQHLLFRYFYEPGYDSNIGNLGFTDQYFASIDAMHWFIELTQLPDVGSYKFNAATNTYDHVGEDLEMEGSDMTLLPGQGYARWSAYQPGLQGFGRVERSGVFWDKFYALWALARREWDLNYNLDESYNLNFYSFFDVEMTELFGGMVVDNPRWFAPRVQFDDDGEPVVQNMSWLRDNCTEAGVTVPCRGNSDTEYPGPAIGGTSNEILRDWATVLALSEFSVYYDTGFEQRLSIWKVGNGDGFELATTRPDGTPICEYGAEGCVDPGYILYTSDRLHTTYQAVKITPRYTYNLDEEQLGFQLLLKLTNLQDRVNELSDIENPSATEQAELRQARVDLQKNESFLDYLIDVQRQFGVGTF